MVAGRRHRNAATRPQSYQLVQTLLAWSRLQYWPWSGQSPANRVYKTDTPAQLPFYLELLASG
jgi:hypothetical protein